MKLIASLLASTILVVPGVAFAQEKTAEDAEPYDGTIVVTAQNRTENVQDVPIVIDVVSGEQVKDAGITDLAGIQRLAPVLNVTVDGVNARVAIRGVGTNSNDETQDQTVAINIDGEFLNRGGVLNASLFDMERVEVLRGPQGTLYGRNSTAGAVNFITRKPGDTFSANGSISYGNFDHLIVEGGVDVPLGDVGGIRFAGQYSKRDGYNFHPNFNARSQDDDTLGLRASLRLEPVEGLTINAAIEHVYSEVVPPITATFNFLLPGNTPGAGCGGVQGFVEIAPAVPGTQCIPRNTNRLEGINRQSYNAPSTGLGRFVNDAWIGRGRIAYDFGGVTAAYRVGYRTTDRGGPLTLQPNYIFNNFREDVETQSHEFLLTGEETGFKWQAGAFYFNEKQDIERGLYRAPPPPFLLGPNGGYVNYFLRDVNSDSYAVFGQADVSLTDKLTLVVGGRYTSEDRDALFVNYPGAINQPANPLFNTGPVRPTVFPAPIVNRNLVAEDEAFTWTVGLNYQPDADTLVYGRVATGFKGGGFDAVGTYNPEKNTAYEAGAKFNFGPNGQSFVNIAAFYYDYTDLQVNVLIDSALGGQVFNAGSAEIYGAELDAQIAIGENGRLRGSINYVNASYGSLLASIPVLCVNPGCSGNGSAAVGDLATTPGRITQPDLGNNTPPYTPAWTLNLGYDHDFKIGDIGTLTASIFSVFKSAYFTDIFNYNDSRQGSFTQTDANLTFRPTGGQWFIQAFVRNIENERPLSFAAFVVAGADRIYNWQFAPPRTYGMRVGFDF
ncbi:TonB-dependent receptor [Erythrobacter sp. WG]|uniref:TonB-dependent receptor n=1 Tax=Erythrobacter sp. WG TaxID=2985510 RepID=UPI00226EBFC8|nr:TonB-dependent receptor [Erythrobacter sp. WG]MCX9147424.1 TonB-dependent receptor [Erythrobacter sp. WG]